MIKSYAQEENQTRLFDLTVRNLSWLAISARTDAYFHPFSNGVATGSVILLIWGSSDVMAGTMTLGTLVAFHRYIQKDDVANDSDRVWCEI